MKEIWSIVPTSLANYLALAVAIYKCLHNDSEYHSVLIDYIATDR